MTDSITKLIDEIGPGYMPATAYDTAWAARVGEIDSVLSNRALGWLTTHQLPDGSWGAPAPMYYHDRVVCTLAAMIALTYRGHRDYDRVQVNAVKWLSTSSSAAPRAGFKPIQMGQPSASK